MGAKFDSIADMAFTIAIATVVIRNTHISAWICIVIIALLRGRYERLDFDYKRVFYDDLKLLAINKKDKELVSNERPIIKYELEKEIEEVEKRNVEFKEIKGNNPCNSIIDNAEIYIKTDGGKRKLDTFEIQQELQRRLGSK